MKKYFTLSNIIYSLSVLFALGVLAKVFLDRYRLPAGTCPTAYNNHWIYLSIGLLLVATLITTVLDRRAKGEEAVPHKED